MECVRFLDQNEERSAFQYDFLNQLTQENGEVSNTYTYDEHHNRLQKNQEEYIVNFLHELERAGDVEYLNDRSGNRIKSIEEEKEIDYTFDGLDRLIEVQSGNHAVRFTYDSWGRMIYRIYLTLHEGEWEAHLVEPFLYDDQNEMGTFPNQLRILGQGKGAEIGAAIALEIDQKIYFPIHDLFGNVIAVLDKNGKIIEENRFTPFGEERRSSKALHNPWRFQSKRKIGGLVFFGRRFYDPKTGRWLSPDPKGYDEGPNLFGFVKNNPLTYFDLYGLSAESGEGYSVARFANDVGYVYYHSYRTTIEAIATGKIQKMSFHANLFKAIRNVMTKRIHCPGS